jgi:hypothetical protein
VSQSAGFPVDTIWQDDEKEAISPDEGKLRERHPGENRGPAPSDSNTNDSIGMTRL